MQAAYASANDRPLGGASVWRSLSLLATGLIAKASPGRLYGWHLANNNAAAVYVRIYDKATAPTAADTPVMTIEVPLKSAVSLSIPPGIAFVNGISARATTAVADNDTTAPSANDVVINLIFA